MRKACILIFANLIIAFSSVFAQKLDNGQIPLYAEPYYNYKPLKIEIGEYSEQLTTNDTTQLIRLSKKFKANIDNVTIEALYILSIRLYDLGKKDESFYWFHIAKNRARTFIDMLDPEKIGSIGSYTFELKQLFLAFNQIAGIFINGYGFNDFEKGISIYETVKNEVKYIKSYKAVYKNVKFRPDTELENIKTMEIKEHEDAIAYLKTNKEEIMKKRIENGIQSKY